jgi:parvulin-like peptidyl-prolyl isomerase
MVDAAFALHDMFEVSAPVESPQGFHLLKLVQRLPAYVPPLADAAAGIRSRLRWLLIERKKYALGKKYVRRADPLVDIPLLVKVPLPAGILQ